MIQTVDAIRNLIGFARKFVESYDNDEIAGDTVDAIIIVLLQQTVIWGYGAGKLIIELKDLHSEEENYQICISKEKDVPVEESWIPFKVKIGKNMSLVAIDTMRTVRMLLVNNSKRGDRNLSKEAITRVMDSFISMVESCV